MTLQLIRYKNYNYPKIFYAFRLTLILLMWRIG